MKLPDAIEQALEARLGAAVRRARPVAGGDLGESARVELASGRSIFLKRYATAPAGVATSEAEGLQWLAEADALPVATPLVWGPDWLALEWIESAPPAPDAAEGLGRGLARLHAAGAERFGRAGGGWIGPLPQPGHADPGERWSRFYAEQRLAPLTRRACDAGRLPAKTRARLERVIGEIDGLAGPDEPPARLHGDLWAGNVLSDERGRPCLIDPAAYGGHREVDLAMMRLFSGFAERTFAAYHEAAPLAPGWRARVPLYQAYPLLVHVCLFGASYVGRLDDALERALEPDRAAWP